jgi:hypothetical protein
MPTSSSDAIQPMSVSDPDAVALPPLPATPSPAAETNEPSALDEATGEPPPLAESASGEVEIGSGSGSATFDVAPGLVSPDPILRALAEASSSSPPEDAPVEPKLASPRAPVSSSTASPDPLDVLRLDDTAPRRPAVPDRPASQEDVVIEYVNGPNWPMVLLASYASAATLALIWWVVLPRLRGRNDVDTMATPSPAIVAARRADRSHKVEPTAPIPADRLTTIGQPLTLGSLEITPIDVARTDVNLRRASLGGGGEEKEGGTGAMALRLRLRNTSDDTVFVPLDEAFVRDRDDGLSDSFVELDSGERIYLYPLSVDSEWSIVGQDFPALKPGEARETRVVTAADFPSTSSGMTWHLKLRTGLKETAVIGVKVPGTE